ncbi:hypothetical protein HPB48_001020 [Haemaphysalis longicornis]|uniref:Tick transposon n=1 Tax=Haemaphysalis longicornis TaxID=44386 RepID=A0A9J6G376_HAELO|nr:hypothetical protein HPB48_001020 [Haemaphysalis longicornis]
MNRGPPPRILSEPSLNRALGGCGRIYLLVCASTSGGQGTRGGTGGTCVTAPTWRWWQLIASPLVGVLQCWARLLTRLGITIRTPDVRSLPTTVQAAIHATPLPRNMNPDLHPERTQVRVRQLTKTLRQQSNVWYTDATHYAQRPSCCAVACNYPETSFTACTVPTPNLAAPPTVIQSHHDWETALQSNDPEIQLRLVRLALDAPAPVARPHEGTGVSGRAGPGGLGRSHTGH